MLMIFLNSSFKQATILSFYVLPNLLRITAQLTLRNLCKGPVNAFLGPV